MVHPSFPEQPDRPLDLANVVPATPSLIHDSFGKQDQVLYYDDLSLDDGGMNLGQSPGRFGDPAVNEDEHSLIARYSAKLAGRTAYRGPGQLDLGAYPDENLAQRAAIARLEQRNKEILREIHHLQTLRNATSLPSGTDGGGLNSELDTLRYRKMELEGRMQSLQDTRRELMVQLENLMRVLRTQTPREGSPRSPSSLSGVGGEVRSAFRDSTPVSALGTQPMSHTGSLRRLPSGSGKTGTLQGDLLSAADSITNTMSTLVKELGTEEMHDGRVDEARLHHHQQRVQVSIENTQGVNHQYVEENGR